MDKTYYLTICLNNKTGNTNIYFIWISGVSANADPHTDKLRTRVINICDYRRRQPNRSAMEGPLPGETAWMITVFPVPGKYARTCIGSKMSLATSSLSSGCAINDTQSHVLVQICFHWHTHPLFCLFVTKNIAPSSCWGLFGSLWLKRLTYV